MAQDALAEAAGARAKANASEVLDKNIKNGKGSGGDDSSGSGDDKDLEKIEDEYDVSLADEAYKEYVDNGCKSQPIDELWNELGIH